MQSTKEELKTNKLILWLDDITVLRNIILIFFYVFFNVNTFYGKLGKQYGAFYLFTIKGNIL